MKNIISVLFLTAVLFFTGCSRKNNHPTAKLTVDLKMLDSIRQHSDSTYSKPYKRSDFVTAEYYVSKKDSTLTQLMKDSFGMVRQIIIEKNNRRIYFQPFYPNGQKQCELKLDSFGQFDGPAVEYYPNGNKKRTGVYKGGLNIGPWKNYDEDGQYTFTQQFNENGQEVDKFKE